MFDSFLNELLAVVGRLIQSYYHGHTKLLEDRNVIVRRERTITISHVEWARESDKLTRDDPVEIAIFNALKVLVLLHIELGVVVPSKRDCILHTE